MEVKLLLAQDVDRQVYSLRPAVVATVIDDGAVLLDLESKYFYRLNASAWAMVRLFESGATVAGVQEQCRTWGASSEDMASVALVTKTLIEDHLIAPGDGIGAADVVLSGKWLSPLIDRQSEPLHRLINSAFDPSIPLAE
jgi:hypothetical protein